MACPLLDKLPAEIRGRIYEYVLYFDDVPVRHITQLQPFVKKLTGSDGELPFAYERANELGWVVCSDELPFGNMRVDSSVLRTCKTIYTEAIKVFYAQNSISIDIEFFKLQGVNSPTASDLSLAKQLVITFNSACEWRNQLSRSFNTINLPNLFTRCGATFPALQSIVVHTDGTTMPCTTLIDMFQDCSNSPSTFASIDFSNVGQFVASTHSGLTLTVKFKELVDLWQEICDLSSSLEMTAQDHFTTGDPSSSWEKKALDRLKTTNDSLARLTYQAFVTKTVFEECQDDDTRTQMHTFRDAMTRHSRTRPMPFLNDNVFYTNLACPYAWYAPV